MNEAYDQITSVWNYHHSGLSPQINHTGLLAVASVWTGEVLCRSSALGTQQHCVHQAHKHEADSRDLHGQVQPDRAEATWNLPAVVGRRSKCYAETHPRGWSRAEWSEQMQPGTQIFKIKEEVCLCEASPKNCRPVLRVAASDLSAGRWEIWQVGNTIWTSPSQPHVLITSL